MGLREVWQRAKGLRRASGRPATGPGRHRAPMVVEGLITRRAVRVDAEAVDWTVVSRVTVSLRYTNPAAGFVAEQDLVFSANGPSIQVWQFTVGGDSPLAYTWLATYAGHDGSLFTSQEQSTVEDVLALPPTAPGAGVQRSVEVDAGAVDWSVIRRVIVELRYSDPAAGFDTEDHLVFSSDTARTLTWQFTVPDDGPSNYRWLATYVADDGQSRVHRGDETISAVLVLPSGIG